MSMTLILGVGVMGMDTIVVNASAVNSRVETDIVPIEGEFSEETMKTIKDIINTAQINGKNAAEKLEKIEEQRLYEYILRNILENYYNKNKQVELEKLKENIGERAKGIIGNYEIAQKERKQQEKLGYNTERVIIGFEPGTSETYVKTIAHNLFGKVHILNQNSIDIQGVKKEKVNQIMDRAKRKHDTVAVIEISNGQTVSQAISEYQAYKNVKYVEPDYIEKIETNNKLTNDTYSNEQYYLKNINIESGWNAVRDFGFMETFVAVLDTGMQINHPDLKNMYVKSKSVDISIEGYPKLKELSKTYTSEHGTEVAGVIAAQADNGKGIAGVGSGADDEMTKIMVVKCTDSKDVLYRSALINGIYYAVNNGADVINISSGSYQYSEAYQEAINYAYKSDVVIVASAGNDNTSKKHYPSSYEHVISVAATTENNKKANFSNYGKNIDISAPGVAIYTCRIGNKYGKVDGTSFSSPIVAGTIAIMRAYNPDLTTQQIEKILKDKAKNVNLNNMGSGLLNSGLSIQEAKYNTFKNEKEKIESVKPCNKKGSLRVKWEGETYSEGFAIYRATSKDGTYEKIKTQTDKYKYSYVDSNLKAGKRYYYKVKGYMKYGNEKRYCKGSNIKSGIAE